MVLRNHKFIIFFSEIIHKSNNRNDRYTYTTHIIRSHHRSSEIHLASRILPTSLLGPGFCFVSHALVTFEPKGRQRHTWPKGCTDRPVAESEFSVTLPLFLCFPRATTAPTLLLLVRTLYRVILQIYFFQHFHFYLALKKYK